MTDTLLSSRHLDQLAQLAVDADDRAIWPQASWETLVETGATRWCIPKSYGGDELDYPTTLEGYAELASGCLTTCFLLSQRDAACRRLRDVPNRERAQELLPFLAKGQIFATVGIAQLTTSRQHGKPAMTATPEGEDYLLNGVMPWVTGAPQADYFVTGGTLDDQRQILAVIPSSTRGLSVDPPMELMAIQGSLTTSVHCENVRVTPDQILAGPVEKVISKVRSGGPGGLETSALALGLTRSAIRHLHREGEQRPEWTETAERLRSSHDSLWNQLQTFAHGEGAAEEVIALRGRANHLVLQATQTALTASKGTGFLRSHPAQAWARQAMFFLVWACPRPAIEATLAGLLVGQAFQPDC